MKKCLVKGLGKSGISALKALNYLGICSKGADKRELDEITAGKADLDWLKEIYLDKEKVMKELNNFDTLIKSPGISFDNDIIKKAKECGLLVIDELEFAYRFLPPRVKIIAVTGTNGKTTTTSLLGCILKESGYNCHVAGNIGNPLSSLIGRVKSGDVIVVEVSSFQLEGIIDFKADVAVLLNFALDHLDRHKNFNEYIKAKAKIFENQNEEDTAVLNFEDENCFNLAENLKSEILYFSLKEKVREGACLEGDNLVIRKVGRSIEVIKKEDIKIPGEHNLENILASLCVANSLDLSLKVVNKGVKSFKGVEHRLEMVGEYNSIIFYNDSKATNVRACEIAIKALKSTFYKTPVVVILGGMDKGEEFDGLVNKLKEIDAHAMIYGQTQFKWKEVFEKNNFNNFISVSGVKEAVKKAFEFSYGGGTVLFSPACASWDMFNSFEERGKLFKEEVYKRGGYNIEN